MKKAALTIAIVVVLGAIAAWLWVSHRQPAFTFTTATLKKGDVAATISASGTIEPVEVVDVGAQVAGRISSFGTDINGKTVDYGSVVKEDALLARIDDAVYAADLSVAKARLEQDRAAELSSQANLQQTKAKFAQTEAEWNRSQELNRSKLLAASDYDSAKANFEIARANVAVAEAAIAQARASTIQSQAAVEKAQRNLDFCTINSPVSGVIIDRRVNIGQTVVASLNAPSLFLIARDLTKMQIWVAVNEADVGRIKPGAPVTFTVDAFPGREFQGAVGKVRLNATMTQNVVLYTVEIDIQNPDKLLLPYLTANVRFVLSHETNALLVPNAALRWSPSSLAQIAPEARAGNADPPANDPPINGSPTKTKGQKSMRRTLWIKEGEFVRPIEVTAGTTDGVNTAVVAQALREGQEVVTGEATASAQAEVKNPFLPSVIRR